MSANTGFSSLFSSGSTASSGSSFGSVSRGSSGFTGVGSFARSSPFSRFQSNKFVSGTREFLQSNSIVAKFAFLLLVLLVFVVLLRIGAWIIGLFFQHDSDPMLIDGMVDAKQMHVIPQNPNIKGSKSILRSINQRDGLEFTWVCWMWIDDLEYKSGQYRHVFHKGNDAIRQQGDMAGVSYPNNAPGLYIAPNTNELVVIMNTFDDISEEVKISDIPIKKWICVMIRCTGRNLDVFINGVLTQRHVLSSVPKQNYGDVYVSMNGGFSGYTSSLQYFNHSLGMGKIQSLVSKGPSLKMKDSDLTKTKPHYLSSRWFFVGTEDAYNP
jgi:hypothetical protein